VGALCPTLISIVSIMTILYCCDWRESLTPVASMVKLVISAHHAMVHSTKT
jgi:hypothetical protein